jgi:hypothetical protein
MPGPTMCVCVCLEGCVGRAGFGHSLGSWNMNGWLYVNRLWVHDCWGVPLHPFHARIFLDEIQGEANEGNLCSTRI